jgi:hypothetical protein
MARRRNVSLRALEALNHTIIFLRATERVKVSLTVWGGTGQPHRISITYLVSMMSDLRLCNHRGPCAQASLPRETRPNRAAP